MLLLILFTQIISTRGWSRQLSLIYNSDTCTHGLVSATAMKTLFFLGMGTSVTFCLLSAPIHRKYLASPNQCELSAVHVSIQRKKMPLFKPSGRKTTDISKALLIHGLLLAS
ncbi:hypothetical protein BX666DRAFT_1903569 [Dichotomocladium elegans]|nr:hypothetical protein BX666DRAFT_1903569 [Dichotomocladium elegans]